MATVLMVYPPGSLISPAMPTQFHAILEDDVTGEQIADITHDPGTVWTAQAPAVLSITSSGYATAHATTGSAPVTCTNGAYTKQVFNTAAAEPVGLISITIQPFADHQVEVGDTDSFWATGAFTTGGTRYVDNLATWASSNPAAFTVDDVVGTKGVVHGVALGTGNVTATIGAIVGTQAMTVVNPPPPPPPPVQFDLCAPVVFQFS